MTIFLRQKFSYTLLNIFRAQPDTVCEIGILKKCLLKIIKALLNIKNL